MSIKQIVAPFSFSIALGVASLAAQENDSAMQGRTPASTAEAKPNVLFIYIDDLNDWVGYMGGNPQAKTPHIDRLANRGVAFRTSLCPAPMCFPSRTATLTGRYPSSTGMYRWNDNFRMLPEIYRAPSLPEYFRKNGWLTYGAGKVYGLFTCPVTPNSNQDVPAEGQPPLSWTAFKGWGGTVGNLPPEHREKFKRMNPNGASNYPFGPSIESDEELIDYHSVQWLIKQLQTAVDNQPVFLVAGINLPHAPFVVPQKWFDLYPLDSIHLPEAPPDDLSDISPYAKMNMGHPAERAWFDYWQQQGEAKNIVQAYLASISFADHCVGLLLDALDKSPRKDNTIVVLVSDNGFHLGEKGNGGKWSLWHEGNKVPLIISAPGLPKGRICEHPVDHISLYPTLAEMCGLPIPDTLDGVSIKPLLENPDREWERPALCTKSKGNHNLRTQDWSFIQYADGSQELYDIKRDPQEYTNLASNPEYAPIIKLLQQWLPSTDAPDLPNMMGKYPPKGSNH